MLKHGRANADVIGDLLLVASVLTVVPSWIAGLELLSALGVGTVPATVVGGAYAWGRGGLSAAILLRRWRRGTFTLTGAWFFDGLETAANRSPMADYPAPAPMRLSLSTGAAGPIAA